jgi:hypothetical protein
MSNDNKENNVGMHQALDKICTTSIDSDKLRLDQPSRPEPLIQTDHVPSNTATIQPPLPGTADQKIRTESFPPPNTMAFFGHNRQLFNKEQLKDYYCHVVKAGFKPESKYDPQSARVMYGCLGEEFILKSGGQGSINDIINGHLFKNNPDAVVNDKGKPSLFNNKVEKRPDTPVIVPDNFNKNASAFSKDPWGKQTPLAFQSNLIDKDEDIEVWNEIQDANPELFDADERYSKDKRKQQMKTRKAKVLQKHIDKEKDAKRPQKTVPEAKTQTVDLLPPGWQEQSGGIFPPDDDSEAADPQPPKSSASSSDEEQGEEFELPQRILVEEYPFYNNFVTGASLIKMAYYTYSTVKNLIVSAWSDNSLTVTQIRVAYAVIKLMWGFYLIFQTHYMTPYVSVFLEKTGQEKPCVKRHFKNQLSTQTPTIFQDYVYKPMLQVPKNHWIVDCVMKIVKPVSKFLETKINEYFGTNYDYQYELPTEVALPAFLRVEDMTKFYDQNHGQLVPKIETVNKDLFQRVCTTKALNHHQPIEQQMKTITALINNQTDINHSQQETLKSTVSSTLTVMKFHILNQTEKVAVLGFDRASSNLSQNMDTGIIRLIHGGGRISQRSQKPPLSYDPSQTFFSGFTSLLLYSAILVLPIVIFRNPIRTTLTQLQLSLEKLNGQVSPPLLLYSVLEESESTVVRPSSMREVVLLYLRRNLSTRTLTILSEHGKNIKSELEKVKSVNADTVNSLLNEMTDLLNQLILSGPKILRLCCASMMKIAIDDVSYIYTAIKDVIDSGVLKPDQLNKMMCLATTGSLSVIAALPELALMHSNLPCQQLKILEETTWKMYVETATVLDMRDRGKFH